MNIQCQFLTSSWINSTGGDKAGRQAGRRVNLRLLGVSGLDSCSINNSVPSGGPDMLAATGACVRGPG